jgi:signal peptidase II
MKWLWLAALVVAVDQLTKFVAVSQMELYESIKLLPFFNLTLLHNYGAAFSMLHDAGGWQRWFFSGLAAVVSVVLIYWIPRMPEQRLGLPLALILGGTLGNLVDRLVLGYVVDFLDFHLLEHHWPAFNIADSAITVGAVLLVLDTLRQPSEDAASKS